MPVLTTDTKAEELFRSYEGELVDVFSDNDLSKVYSTLVELGQLDIDWFVRAAGDIGPSTIDLCGGAGRVGLALAEQGTTVTVIDNSERMLEVGRRNQRSQSSSATFLRGDARSFKVETEVDSIIIGGLSLTMFTKPDREMIYQACQSALRPGGKILFDYSPVDPFGRFDCMTLKLRIKVDSVSRDVSIVSRRNALTAYQKTVYILHGGDGEFNEIDKAGTVDFSVFDFAELSQELYSAGFAVERQETFYENPVDGMSLPPHSYVVAGKV